jgi:dTDP-4-amino-4,6-dideoxygalactose transaminase
VSVYKSEPIPASAQADVSELLATGELFRYTAPKTQANHAVLLEAEFAQMMGAKYALAVNSCSSALFLSLKALDLPSDANVLIPAFTFAAVPSAVVHAGATPVLVECGANYRMVMSDFRRKLDASVGAVIVSHMRGHTSDMDEILALCANFNVAVIEDAAHSLGTLWNGKKIGTLGAVGCFSFQSYKMINGGEGGILITDDADIAAKTTLMSGAYELNWEKHALPAEVVTKYQNQFPHYNMRMNNLSAAVIRHQLPELDRRVRDGLANYTYVADLISQCPGIDVPKSLPGEVRAPDSLQFNLVDYSDAEVDSFIAAAAKHGVEISVFGRQINNARAFWNWHFLGQSNELPDTRAMLMRACDTRLPARLTRHELDSVVNGIINAAGDVKPLSVKNAKVA